LTRVRSGSASLAECLAEQIRLRGRITFAEYMEACLYHPEYGYYTRKDQSERRDYITSVDVTPIFGRLLSRQFRELWTLLGQPEAFTLVEAGAGTGQLARHVLDFAAADLPEFYSALRYITVERSASRRNEQAKKLESHLAAGRFSSRADMPAEISDACVFSNELLDAFPVHRVAREGGELKEIFVAGSDSEFHEETGPLSSRAITAYFEEQEITLQEGQIAEVNFAACQWIEDVARRLRRGFVLTIDYGHEAKELYDERHMRGTLLAYDRHRVSEDFYRAPGEQDLTAHVNFTALDFWGGPGGLTRCGFTSQTNFLLALARHANFADLNLDEAAEPAKAAARSVFKTLIHPEGMGETFRVLLQCKGISCPRLAGFEPL
jgi:SAM-dependent MidA family methyltransferase